MKSVCADVSEERGASIFRVQVGEVSGRVSYLEDRGSSFLRNSIAIYRTTRHIPEDKWSLNQTLLLIQTTVELQGVYQNVLGPSVTLHLEWACVGSCVVSKFDRNW